MPKAIVYSTRTCPYCTQAKDYLKSKGVTVQDIDVGADIVGRQEMMSISGQMGVPVIRIGNEVIVGFNRQAIDDAIAGEEG